MRSLAKGQSRDWFGSAPTHKRRKPKAARRARIQCTHPLFKLTALFVTQMFAKFVAFAAVIVSISAQANYGTREARFRVDSVSQSSAAYYD